MQPFSQLLENRVIEYFKRKHSLDISPATAQEYLNSFAELFLTYAEIEQEKRTVPADALARRDGTLPTDSHSDLTLGVSNT